MKAGSQSWVPRGLASLFSDLRRACVVRPLPLATLGATLIMVGGNNAAAQNQPEAQKVYITVRVIDDDDKEISGAEVRVRLPGDGKPDRRARTDDKGLARVTVEVASGVKLDLEIEVTHEGMAGQKRPFNLGTNFPARPPPIEFQLKKKGADVAQDQSVYLVTRVINEEGKPIPGARVYVYQEHLTGYRLTGIAAYDYSETTNADGMARITVNVPHGKILDIAVEAVSEGLQTDHRYIKLEKFPARLPLEEFRLTKKSDAGAGMVINVVIEVRSDEKPVEGASVLIRDTSLGAASGQFRQVTGADGKASIPVLFASADQEETLPVEVSRSGYRNGKATVKLTRKQTGKTIVGPTVKLEKVAKNAAKVTIIVLDAKKGHRVEDANVILDGPGHYSMRTNREGEAPFLIGEFGGYQVKITHDTYEDFTDGIRLLEGQDIPHTFHVEPKEKKAEGHDTIDVTVLKNDSTAEKGEKIEPTPLAGATARAGTISKGTDANGKAILEGAFMEKQEVSVQAPGFKAQTKVIKVNKFLHEFKGDGSVTFTLDPDLSAESPIRVIVEVLGPCQDKKVVGAKVEFLLPNGTVVGRSSTEKDGTADFRSSDAPNVPIAELRKGLAINVKKDLEYKGIINRSIPPKMLEPRLEAARFVVDVERDWSELEKAVGDLEGQIDAWKGLAQSVREKRNSVADLSTKGAAARRRAAALLAELKAARKAADAKRADDGCKEARELERRIEKWWEESAEKEKLLRSTLDEAIALATSCNSKADVDAIRAKYKSALVLTGELGKMEKQARVANERLTQLAQGLTGAKPTAQLQQFVDKIEEEVSAAGKDAAAADNGFDDALRTSNGLRGSRAQLWPVFEKMRDDRLVRDCEAALTKDLRKRLANLEAVLSPTGTDMSLSMAIPLDRTRLNVIKETVTVLEEYKVQAAEIVGDYKTATCDVRPSDETVNGIGQRVVGATIELGAASDLLEKADACAAKLATASPTPAEDDITVPDVSGFDDPGAMKAAAGPDMVGVIMATKNTPPAGTKKLFAYQDPAANSKAKRGSTLKIYIYQSLATVSSTTPTPIPSQTPSPAKSPSDEITVPDVSGFDDPGAMKAAAGPNMVGVIMATKNTPPAGTKKLFAYQEPPANSKAKRGSTLKIFIYQSIAVVSSPTPATTPLSTPSPSPLSSPSPSASVSASDEITVPDVSGFSDPKAMKAAAGPDMVGVIMATKNTPPPGSTRLFASQDPPANTKAKRGSILKIYIYQSLADAGATPSPTASPSPSPSPSAVTAPSSSPTTTGSIPNLIGLTLDQAVTRLPAKMEILSDEIGDKPPTPEKALTIFSQTPAAGATFDPNNPPIVKVRRYGSAKTASTDTGSEPFVGTWVGVSLYPSASEGVAVEMTIRKQGSGYVIEAEGVAYPLQSDGTKVWHTVGQYQITYRRAGDTLAGDWRFTNRDGDVTTGQITLNRK